LHHARPFELDPVVIARETLLQAPVMNTPASNQKIKVVDSGRLDFCIFHFVRIRFFIFVFQLNPLLPQ
jgi:hypothetical protein